jgi:hypothetical protein
MTRHNAAASMASADRADRQRQAEEEAALSGTQGQTVVPLEEEGEDEYQVCRYDGSGPLFTTFAPSKHGLNGTRSGTPPAPLSAPVCSGCMRLWASEATRPHIHNSLSLPPIH